MGLLKDSIALTFDDVLIEPTISTVASRSNVDVSVDLEGLNFQIPIVSAPMDTVTEVDMATAMAQAGGFGVLHRFVDPYIQAKWVEQTKPYGVAAAVGLGRDEQLRVDALVNAGCRVICVDVANGQNENAAEMVRWINNNYSDVYIIGGNVATALGVKFLQDAGASMIRVGIGGGSFCTTRVATGIGVPQLTAIMKCSEAASVPIIADGGIRKPSDFAKAIAAGADLVMLGGMLVGTDESPGEIITRPVKNSSGITSYAVPPEVFKVGRGMASAEAQESRGIKPKNPEGIEAKVPYVGPTVMVLDRLLSGLRSAMSYVGATNLLEFKQNAHFIRVTNAGVAESHPHILTY